MWEKIIEFFLAQGFAGIAILCLGATLVLFYKENKKEREEYKKERAECTERYIKVATDSTQVIQASTSTLKEMRDDMKQHNDEVREHQQAIGTSMEKLLILLDTELKSRGRG